MFTKLFPTPDKSSVGKVVDEDPPKNETFWTRHWTLLLTVAFIAGLGVAAAVITPSIMSHERGERDHHQRQSNHQDQRLDSDNPGHEHSAPVRTYFIQAELVNWNYQPQGRDLCSYKPNVGPPTPEPRWKAVYRPYSDSNFQNPIPRTEEDLHLGILGPYIRAEAGTSISVVFRNNATIPLNIEPSGLLYDTPGNVNPGDTVTYVWRVPSEAAPSAEDQTSSTLWLYRSTVHVTSDLNAGLFGPIIVTRAGEAMADGRPKGVDRELVAMLQIMDETNALDSILESTGVEPREKSAAVVEEPEKPDDHAKHHTINGLMDCNGEGFNVSNGAKARFYVGALGNEADVHTMHWHGVTMLRAGRRVDQVVLLAGSTAALDFDADNPGSWYMHCHVNAHLAGGMKALLTISDGPKPEPTATVHQYYIAAEMQEWDYAPQGKDLCSGTPTPFSEDAEVFLKPGPQRIGNKYLKARYVEYTDETFTTKKERSAAEAHLGVQGPVLRAEVGNTIQVLFLNRVPEHPVSMHPHGVLYRKNSEGALYGDYTSGADKADDGVPTNQTHMYVWVVPERSGPGPADPNSIVWLYHSHVDEMLETYAGLYGAIVVMRKGEMQANGLPKGVDNEAFLVFVVSDEVRSLLFMRNMARYLNMTKADAIAELETDEDFQESNLMHSINGFMFCNLPGLDTKQGQNTRWYLMGYGNEVDMHTPNLFASRFNFGSTRRQSMRLLPGSMIQADVTAMVPGTWPIMCHVNDHIIAGMRALYRVEDAGKLAEAASGVTRSYFIQAEELIWDYTPLGYDGCSGRGFDEEQRVFTRTSENTMGAEYRKAVFRGYTDATFTQRSPSPAFMGLLGPLLRAEAGDTLEVTFKNNVSFPVSLQLSGGMWPLTPDSSPAQPVPRGNVKVYSFQVPADAAPAEGSSVGVSAFMYVSGQDVVGSSYAGLVGLMLVGRKGTFTGPEGRTKDVDMELPLLFSVMDENQSPFLSANVAQQQRSQGIKAINTSHPDFEESNKMHSINGFNYCNLPQLSLPTSSKALLILMGLGTEVDMHGPVFMGQDVQVDGHPEWAPVLMPASIEVGLLTTSSTPGSWEFYCMVADHYAAGMRAKMTVVMTPGRKLLR